MKIIGKILKQRKKINFLAPFLDRNFKRLKKFLEVEWRKMYNSK